MREYPDADMRLYAVRDRNVDDCEPWCVLVVAPNRSRAVTLAWAIWPGWYDDLRRSGLRACVCPGANVPADATEKAYDDEPDAPPWVNEWWCLRSLGEACSCRWCQKEGKDNE
jgi:hypothetical protein